jgi:hypothetical protein
MPICQESFVLIVLCICHTPPVQPWTYIVGLSLYETTLRSLPPIGAMSESTDKDSVLNICERITVKYVQSQPSLTQSARAAMSNIVWINRVKSYVCVCFVLVLSCFVCVVFSRLSFSARASHRAVE